MEVIYSSKSLRRLNNHLAFLQETLEYSDNKIIQLRRALLSRADSLALNPYIGLFEIYLDHLKEDHRRIIEGLYKIIYYIEDDKVFISDFFDTREDPSKMRG